MRLLLFFGLAVLWGASADLLPSWLGYPLGILIGVGVAMFRRPITRWISRDIACPDPWCLRCRMSFVDMRRMEIEIMEQVRAQAEVRGERTH